jgi:hypothetical protein
LYVPTSLLFAVPFIRWVAIRSRKSIESRLVTWPVPMVLGVLLFPLLFVSIPLLIEITGQGQGNLIGSCIATTMIVLPLILGEVSFWCGRRRNAVSAPGRS